MTSEKIIMTTTPTVEGKTVSEYLAVVDGQVTQNRGMSFELRFNECLADMCKTAGSLGADAIIGIQFSIDDGLVCAIGTAVKLK
ncbi:MAG: YbjQ family protein [Gammaproteobacteria bacterium]